MIYLFSFFFSFLSPNAVHDLNLHQLVLCVFDMKSDRIKSLGQRTRDRDDGQRWRIKKKGGVRFRKKLNEWEQTINRQIKKVRKTEKPKKTKIREFKEKFCVSHHLLSLRLINDGDYLAGIGHILSEIEKGVKTHTKKAAIWIMMIVLLQYVFSANPLKRNNLLS